ncbi:hypothetical protein AWB66_04943 [Caballeronia telluris]|uniref:Transposase n=1 Tax=Caballeronia telluris TaxID=326475 RepID=A0A158K0R6_9BURK|nr:hypothetical protein AWB66_04943 [Caballeronia telluris]
MNSHELSVWGSVAERQQVRVGGGIGRHGTSLVEMRNAGGHALRSGKPSRHLFGIFWNNHKEVSDSAAREDIGRSRQVRARVGRQMVCCCQRCWAFRLGGAAVTEKPHRSETLTRVHRTLKVGHRFNLWGVFHGEVQRAVEAGKAVRCWVSGTRALAQRHGVTRTVLRRWIAAYEQQKRCRRPCSAIQSLGRRASGDQSLPRKTLVSGHRPPALAELMDALALE